MKKALFILFLIAILSFFSACSHIPQASRSMNNQTSVETVLQQGMEKADAVTEFDQGSVFSTAVAADTPMPLPTNTTVPVKEVDSNSDGIDVDLTKMSSTMIYSEVYAMMTDSKQYIGKKVRMRGEFSGFYDKQTGQYYFACLIRDAMACCAQGLEFVLTDDYFYPDDYPPTGTDITVTGIFEPYQEGNFTFYHLANAVLEE